MRAWRLTRGDLGAGALLCLLLCGVSPAQSQTRHADPYRFWSWPIEDSRAFIGSVTSSRMLYAAGVGGLLLAVATQDEGVTEFSEEAFADYDGVVKVLEEMGNVKAVRPAVIMLFLGSLMTDDTRMQDAAFTSLEGVILSNLVTNSLKAIVGRARPWQGQGALRIQPFSGNSSFPSGHATTVFALLTPWILYYPGVVAPALLVIGMGSAFTRIVTEFHWLSDILAGSAIGFATSYWLTRRHQHDTRRVEIAPTLGSDQVGLAVRVRF